ncbi:MAG: hypothetical protein H0V29_07150 [Thermoleophilaceae bacterium]|nr:hypothetical protein [Thermoleophilaceae bacterium]
MKRVAILTCPTCLIGASSANAAELPDSWQKGANVGAFWWKDLDDKRFPMWMSRLKANGTDSVLMAVPWYQDSLSSTELKPSYGTTKKCKRADGSNYSACKTPSMASVRKAIERAQGLGMKVGLKPLVEVGVGDESARPRSSIDLKNPGAVRAWFDSYKNMLSQYARLARDAGDGKGGFAVKLSYAANWNTIGPDAADPAAPLFFWDVLDEIGIEGYFPLVKPTRSGAHDNPSRGTLADGWSNDVGGFDLSPVDLLRSLNKEYG